MAVARNPRGQGCRRGHHSLATLILKRRSQAIQKPAAIHRSLYRALQPKPPRPSPTPTVAGACRDHHIDDFSASNKSIVEHAHDSTNRMCPVPHRPSSANAPPEGPCQGPPPTSQQRMSRRVSSHGLRGRDSFADEPAQGYPPLLHTTTAGSGNINGWSKFIAEIEDSTGAFGGVQAVISLGRPPMKTWSVIKSSVVNAWNIRREPLPPHVLNQGSQFTLLGMIRPTEFASIYFKSTKHRISKILIPMFIVEDDEIDPVLERQCRNIDIFVSRSSFERYLNSNGVPLRMDVPNANMSAANGATQSRPSNPPATMGSASRSSQQGPSLQIPSSGGTQHHSLSNRSASQIRLDGSAPLPIPDYLSMSDATSISDPQSIFTRGRGAASSASSVSAPSEYSVPMLATRSRGIKKPFQVSNQVPHQVPNQARPYPPRLTPYNPTNLSRTRFPRDENMPCGPQITKSDALMHRPSWDLNAQRREQELASLHSLELIQSDPTSASPTFLDELLHGSFPGNNHPPQQFLLNSNPESIWLPDMSLEKTLQAPVFSSLGLQSSLSSTTPQFHQVSPTIANSVFDPADIGFSGTVSF